MPVKNKNDILREIITALLDENSPVSVETLDAKYEGHDTYTSANTPQMPAPHKDNEFNVSGNALHAQSLKIGKNISIKRQNDGGHFKYVVRTPNGEMQFDENDRDFMAIWGNSLSKYDKTHGDATLKHVKDNLSARLQDENLRNLAQNMPINSADKRSKFEKAMEQLKSMGIEPNILAKYISENQNE